MTLEDRLKAMEVLLARDHNFSRNDVKWLLGFARKEREKRVAYMATHPRYETPTTPTTPEQLEARARAEIEKEDEQVAP